MQTLLQDLRYGARMLRQPIRSAGVWRGGGFYDWSRAVGLLASGAASDEG